METQSTNLKLIKLDSDTWERNWDLIRRDCINLTDWGIERFESLKDSVKSIILEDKYICKDYRNVYSNFISKKFKEISMYSNRLHFFNTSNFDLDDAILSSERLQMNYIGYSVIRPINNRCIGRTIIDPYKLENIDKNNFYCLTTNFKANINGAKYIVRGYPYISQSTDVTVCAHSALWNVCRYLSERYSEYKEIYPFDIVKYTDPFGGRTFPYRAMTYTDYSIILTKFGTYPIMIRMKNDPTDNTFYPGRFNDLYSYIESGFPILASLYGHVITIIGHTVDYGKEISKMNPIIRNYYCSSNFVDRLVVIDDNCFPYQLLGNERDGLNYGSLYPQNYSINSIYTIACPLPEKVFLTSEKIRKMLAKDILPNDYVESTLNKFSKGPWIIRLFLTNSTNFKRNKLPLIKEQKGSDQLNASIVSIFMPHFIWVVEISSIEQYKKKKCVGEIIIDSTASGKEEKIIYTRLGNILYFHGKNVEFATENFEFQQFMHNLGIEKY